MATPVEVSLWVRAYRSTSGSGRASGWLPNGLAITWGSSRNGAAVTAAANLAENSPNTRCWLRRSIREKLARSQNRVEPPLPSATS
jgi:hypothetical protein